MTETDNPVLLQLLCDGLSDQGIHWRVDAGGYANALAPGTGLFVSRVMVDEAQLALAVKVMEDLGVIP